MATPVEFSPLPLAYDRSVRPPAGSLTSGPRSGFRNAKVCVEVMRNFGSLQFGETSASCAGERPHRAASASRRASLEACPRNGQLLRTLGNSTTTSHPVRLLGHPSRLPPPLAASGASLSVDHTVGHDRWQSGAEASRRGEPPSRSNWRAGRAFRPSAWIPRAAATGRCANLAPRSGCFGARVDSCRPVPPRSSAARSRSLLPTVTVYNPSSSARLRCEWRTPPCTFTRVGYRYFAVVRLMTKVRRSRALLRRSCARDDSPSTPVFWELEEGSAVHSRRPWRRLRRCPGTGARRFERTHCWSPTPSDSAPSVDPTACGCSASPHLETGQAVHSAPRSGRAQPLELAALISQCFDPSREW